MNVNNKQHHPVDLMLVLNLADKIHNNYDMCPSNLTCKTHEKPPHSTQQLLEVKAIFSQMLHSKHTHYYLHCVIITWHLQ